MIPNFDIFGKTISAYMLLALAGVFVTLFFTYKAAKKNNADEIDTLYMMLFSFAGAILGGHILYGITKFHLIIELISNFSKLNSMQHFISYVQAIFGGSVFYGGLIGALLAGFIYVKSKHLNAGEYTDVGALAIPLFHTFGRIGCFLSGCCYGIEWSYGITYHYSLSEGANGVARFPVQLVEATLNLALFFVIYYFYKKQLLKNRLLAFYLIVYPIYRFILEFIRGDEYRGYFGILSTSQLISIILFASSLIYLIYNKIKRKNKTDI